MPHCKMLAFIAFHEYCDASSSIQFPAIICFTKAEDMYYNSTKTTLQICTVKILAIKRESCATKVWHTDMRKVPCVLSTLMN